MLRRAGLRPTAGLSLDQRKLPLVKRVALLGSLVGVVSGCCLGLVNLLLIDTERSSTLKSGALDGSFDEFGFEVHADNTARPDATTLTVRGPDIDGVLASMTAALASAGCRVVEMHARSSSLDERRVEDTFVVQSLGRQVDDDALEEVSARVLAATKDPLQARSLKAELARLQEEVAELRRRNGVLERAMARAAIKTFPSNGQG
mmetsp:Transcript_5469/g.17625  ORF Transcript_5469/g.17625 Transcript_5469/m.17625 type:complete len:204 (-) Transcript_5469:169-780(-)